MKTTKNDCNWTRTQNHLVPVAVTSPSDFASASSKEFLDIQATIECGFTLKRVRDMTRTYRQQKILRHENSNLTIFKHKPPIFLFYLHQVAIILAFALIFTKNKTFHVALTTPAILKCS